MALGVFIPTQAFAQQEIVLSRQARSTLGGVTYMGHQLVTYRNSIVHHFQLRRLRRMASHCRVLVVIRRELETLFLKVTCKKEIRIHTKLLTVPQIVNDINFIVLFLYVHQLFLYNIVRVTVARIEILVYSSDCQKATVRVAF